MVTFSCFPALTSLMYLSVLDWRTCYQLFVPTLDTHKPRLIHFLILYSFTSPLFFLYMAYFPILSVEVVIHPSVVTKSW